MLAHAPVGHAAAPVAIFSLSGLAALATLTILEVVLGIDNVVFLAILTNKLEPKQQATARRVGLGLALVARILLLLTIGWLMTLTKPLFTLLDHDFSGKDLILLAGGVFLLTKATTEIYHNVEGDHHAGSLQKKTNAAFGAVVAQIVMMDVIFSLDSVITAVGMTQNIPIMIAAVIIAIGIMLAFAGPISAFIDRHPSLKILALAFLVLIGVLLAADGLGEHLPRGYVYTAMAFAIVVELLQMRAARKHAAPKRQEAEQS
ncbi:MAG: TerC family protein [Phycisphaerales bacterium]|nr:TerC family protein [Phycisphaerales bacterium]